MTPRSPLVRRPELDQATSCRTSMTQPPIAQNLKPAPPLLEAFWGKGDAAKALYREVQEIIARKYPPPTKPAAPTRKPRKPSIRKLVEQAEKATGKAVTAVTLPDGTKLDLGVASPAELTSSDPVTVAAF